MKYQQRQWVLALSVAFVAGWVGTGLAGCADESAPNRRGIERAPLTGNGGTDNAYKRENEAPKRDLPTGGGKEFPGQSQLPASAQPAADVVYLADMGTETPNAITPLAVPATTATAPATIPGPAIIPAAPTAATTPVETFPATNGATTMVVPSNPPVVATTIPASATAKSTQPLKPRDHFDDSDKRYAVPGKAMPVAGTGLSIPADWGEPVVLSSYPHRAWPNTVARYESGTTYHNPYYFQELFNRTGSAYGDRDPVGAYWADQAETPWFFGETIALPVLMCIDLPLAQRTTQEKGTDPLYLGHLPPTGPVIPAPAVGEVKFVYPPMTMPSDVP